MTHPAGTPMRRRARAAARTLALLAGAAFLVAGAEAPNAWAGSEKVSGIVERVDAGGIVVDSARVVLAPGGRVSGDASSPAGIKVGWWAEAKGRWTKGSLFETGEIEAKRDAPGASFAEKLSAMSAKESKKLDESDRIYKDPNVNAYISGIGHALVPEYARDDFAFSFEVIQDPSLNAFALPGGAIYVHTGLLAKLDNEAQLAVILGHEISHVTQRHGQRQYRSNMAILLPAQIGAILLGAEVSRRTDNPLVGIMAGLGLELGMAAAVSGYGRTLEDQSDRVGLRYAVEKGYEPKEAPRVWDTFTDVYGDQGRIENFFYGNHSTNSIRQENLKDEIRRHYRAPKRVEGAPLPPPRTVESAKYQKATLDLARDNAVLDFKVKRYELAQRGFDRVRRFRPRDPVAHHYTGRIILATEEGPGALERGLEEMKKAVDSDPGYADAYRDIGIVYREMGRTADARANLEAYLAKAPADAPDRKDVQKALASLKG